MKPDKDIRRLQTLLFAMVLVAVLIIIVFETGLLPSPLITGKGNLEMIIGTIMVFITLLSIPLALGIVKAKAAEKPTAIAKESGFFRTSVVRILMLGIPLVLNTAFYFIFMKASFAYMGIILLLAYFFVLPTQGRYQSHMNKDDTNIDSNS